MERSARSSTRGSSSTYGLTLSFPPTTASLRLPLAHPLWRFSDVCVSVWNYE